MGLRTEEQQRRVKLLMNFATIVVITSFICIVCVFYILIFEYSAQGLAANIMRAFVGTVWLVGFISNVKFYLLAWCINHDKGATIRIDRRGVIHITWSEKPPSK